MRMYRMRSGGKDDMSFPTEATLVVNANSPLITRLGAAAESDADKAKKIARQIYTLALLSQRQLTADELQDFLMSSFDILENI